MTMNEKDIKGIDKMRMSEKDIKGIDKMRMSGLDENRRPIYQMNRENGDFKKYHHIILYGTMNYLKG